MAGSTEGGRYYLVMGWAVISFRVAFGGGLKLFLDHLWGFNEHLWRSWVQGLWTGGALCRKIMLNVVTALNVCSLTVDKNKSRTSSRNQQPPTNGQPDLVPPESKSRNVEYYKALCEKNQTIQQLENTLRSSNRRFEAVAVVIKHICAGVSIMRLHCLSSWWIILLCTDVNNTWRWCLWSVVKLGLGFFG